MEDLLTAPAEPLDICVTAAGEETLALRALLRQAAPMLCRPQSFAEGEHLSLAREIDAALCGPETLPAPDDGDAPPDDNDGGADYEPGCDSEVREDWP